MAISAPDNTWATAHQLTSRQFRALRGRFNPGLLVVEVRHIIVKLNGRPDSTDRCPTAVATLLAHKDTQTGPRFLVILTSQRSHTRGNTDSND
ncbi:hypothetical protein [Streptomyces sp. NPDC026673]|uniref:hypothetical protein n=1 Tax=Streptomyces sp. NPDC026673 TaxID=3155724 RepID=UPI0033F1C29B